MEKPMMYFAKFSDGNCVKTFSTPCDFCKTLERLLESYNNYYKTNVKVVCITSDEYATINSKDCIKLYRV